MKWLLTFILIIFASGGFSQVKTVKAYVQWGSLKPGPHLVGYRTLLTTDYSRSYVEGRIGKPIQIYIWYPAKQDLKARRMRYRDYFSDIGNDFGDTSVAAFWKNQIFEEFKSGALSASYSGGINESQLRSVIDVEIPVIRNAEPAKKKFPILLNLHSNGCLTESLMMEFLASHGYVVMSISLYGTSPAFYGRGENSAASLLSQTEDLAFALAQARHLSFADPNKVAMIGMFASAGMSLQMKNMRLSALACLDCYWDETNLRNLPYYDTRKFRIPIFEMVNTDFAVQDKSYLDSCIFSERFVMRFNRFPHSSFYPFKKISRPGVNSDSAYDAQLNYTLLFLNYVFAEDATEKKSFANSLVAGDSTWIKASVKTLRAEAFQPVKDEFFTWLRYGEMEKIKTAPLASMDLLPWKDNFYSVVFFLYRDNARHWYQALELYMEIFPGDARVKRMLDGYGKDLLLARKGAESAELYLLYVQHFSNSPTAYSGLADAYILLDEKQKALDCLENVLRLIKTADLPEQERLNFEKNTIDKIEHLKATM